MGLKKMAKHQAVSVNKLNLLLPSIYWISTDKLLSFTNIITSK